MKSLVRITVLTFVASALWIGCGEKDPSFSLLADGDTFRQSTDKTASKVDILWVIDNSGSMETSQSAVATNLNSFIQNFQGGNYDFRMAVTATDAYRVIFNGNHNCSRFRDGILNSSCNTVSGRTYDGIRIMDSLTLDLTNVFLQNSLLTDSANNIFGSGDERAFQSMRSALDEPLNAGFVRPDSFFSVIIVSDEEDFSQNSSTLNESYSNPGLHTVQSYIDYLDTLTGSTVDRRRYNVNAIAIFDTACRDLLNTTWSGRKIGTRYGQLADATGGIKASLCGDFAQQLQLIEENIRALTQEFFLDRLPKPETIVVKINGSVVPNASTTGGQGGWTYDSTANSIKFSGQYIPPAGASISVNYDPVGYGT